MQYLYVIGNGFDLWHALPTRYDDFYRFAKSTLDELEQYFVQLDSNRDLWSDFENSLGMYNPDILYQQNNHIDLRDESFRISEYYCLEDELREVTDQLVSDIESHFAEWVEGIDVSRAAKQLHLDSEASYVNFNYTETLQLVYGVREENILHIHGKSNGPDKLVFGHGVEIPSEPELDENGDSNRTMSTDAEGAASYPLWALKKPVEEIIKIHQGFFDSLSGCKHIHVLGHSLNSVDLPYFQEIGRRAPNANWTVYYFQEQDKEHFFHQLNKCGIESSRVLLNPYPESSCIVGKVP